MEDVEGCQEEVQIDVSGNAPLIQIFHPNVPQNAEEGVENPVCNIEEEQETAPGQRPRTCSTASTTANPFVQLKRGSVGVGVTINTEQPSKNDTGEPGEASVQSARPSLIVPSNSELGVETLSDAGTLSSDGDSRSVLGVPEGHDQLSLPTTPRWSAAQTPSSLGGSSVQSKSDWSEIIRLDRLSRKDSIGSYHSDDDVVTPALSSAMSERLRDLVQRFSSRTEYYKERTAQPPTPSTDGLDAKSGTSVVSGGNLEPPGRQHRLDSFIPMASRASGASGTEGREALYIGFGKCRIKIPNCLRKFSLNETIDTTSRIYILWLAIVTLAYMYNAASTTLRACFIKARFYEPGYVKRNFTREVCEVVTNITTALYDTITSDYPESWTTENWTAPALAGYTAGLYENSSADASGSYTTPGYSDASTVTFETVCRNETAVRTIPVTVYYPGYETPENRIYWWICDYTADLLYIIDILFVKTRVRFIKNGMQEKNRKECAKNYFSKREFKMDVMSLTPLDILYFIPAVNYNSLLRLPRLLKLRVMWEFFDKMDHMVKSSHFVRVARTLTYMLYLIHIESCGYYAVSAYEGLAKNEWVYDGKGRSYVRCMYLATKTATSIGNNPKPTNQLEFLFMTVYWLSGVFVFAMLIGQIRDIFEMAGAAKDQYRKTMDNTIYYMKSLNIPKDLQDRVKTWFNYNWENSKTLNENSLLEGLPKKMKADLAIHVHFNTLSKVQLFQDCDKNLLFDLVLKLKPVLYLPRDYICRKGEVGTEMYIVMQGQVEVVGGPNNSVVFATLHTGSVFGEISLLALAGGNRRTADVRSKGFSQLFILSKSDFEEAMADYPEAQRILKKKAKKLLKQNAKKTEESNKMEAEEIIRSRQGTPKLLKTVVQLVDPDSKMHALLGTQGTASKSSFSSAGNRPASRTSKLNKGEDHEDEVRTLNKYQLDDDFEDEILVVELTEQSVPIVVDLPTSENESDGQNGLLRKLSMEDTGLTGCLGVSDVSNSSSQVSLKSGISSIMSTPNKTEPGRGVGVMLQSATSSNLAKATIEIETAPTTSERGKQAGKQGENSVSPLHTAANGKPGNVDGGKVLHDGMRKLTEPILKACDKPKSDKRRSMDASIKTKPMPIVSNKISPIDARKISNNSVVSLFGLKPNKVVPAIGSKDNTEMQILNECTSIPSENLVSVNVEVHQEGSLPSTSSKPDNEVVNGGSTKGEQQE